MRYKKILGIAACDPKGVIGKNGKLPWNDPEELRHFSTTIGNSPLIMGHRTFLSLPARYFANRFVIVFSRQQGRMDENPNLIFVASLSEFLALEKTFDELYVIGGAQMYTLFLQENLIQEFILTRLKGLHEGDTFFPLALLRGWSKVLIRETETFSVYGYASPH